MGLQTAISSTRGVANAWRHVTARLPRLPALSSLRRQDGLTVIELCVDVTILAILGLSAVVVMSNYVESGRSRTAAEQVAGALQQARQYAIANAAKYSVTLTGTTVAVACTAGCPLNPPPPSEPATPIISGATTSVPSPAISFDSMGCANSVASPCDSGTASTVTITYPGAIQWQVRVTAAGRVRLCSPVCT